MCNTNNWQFKYEQYANSIRKLYLSKLSRFSKSEQIFHWSYFFNNPDVKWHPFHIVSPSPWPFLLSFHLLTLILDFVSLLYYDYTVIKELFVILCFTILTIIVWFRDIIRESTYMGYHTSIVQTMHRTGFVLFLISEVMIFFGFFWAYFYFALCPSIFNGNIWPPEGIVFFYICENLCSELRLFYLLGYVDYWGVYNPGLLTLKLFNPETFIGELILNTVFKTLLSDDIWLTMSYFFSYFLYDSVNFDNILFFNWYYLKDKFLNLDDLVKYYSFFDFYINNLNKIENKNLYYIWKYIIDFKYFFFDNQFFKKNWLTDEKEKHYYNFYSLQTYNMNPNNIDVKKLILVLYESGALINPLRIPLFNTVILLTSGFILMWSHTCLRLRSYLRCILGLMVTILFACLFLYCQIYEYILAAFSISDGTYGSTFYMLTGLHGLHVFVGTLFLIVCFFRLMAKHFTSYNHLSFEMAIWYWHFVDVIWIFLFLFVYVWPSFFYFSSSKMIIEDELNEIYFYINYHETYLSHLIYIDYDKISDINRFISIKVIFIFEALRVIFQSFLK